MHENTQVNQVLLKMIWQDRLEQKRPLLSLDDVQFRVFSQNGEDGILLYIFSMIGTHNKKFLEICAGNGQECNVANLAINHGWRGLMIDGNEENVDSGKTFYAHHPDTFLWPPTILKAWITRDNINELIASNDLGGDIDLLSLDLDGNDYWILDALDVVQPRVIIAEYQFAWGAERSVTQRYKEDSRLSFAGMQGIPRCGASLPALVKLAKRKGYRLIGCERLCFNAIFIRNDVGEDIFPEIETSECFSHPMAQHCMALVEENPKEITEGFWEEV